MNMEFLFNLVTDFGETRRDIDYVRNDDGASHKMGLNGVSIAIGIVKITLERRAPNLNISEIKFVCSLPGHVLPLIVNDGVVPCPLLD